MREWREGVVLRWSWLGDDFALDVANTVQLVRGRYVDLIDSGQDLRHWAQLETGRVPAGVVEHLAAADSTDIDNADDLADDVARFRALRDHVLALLRAVAAGEPLPPDAVAGVNAAATAAPTIRLLRAPGGTGPQPVHDADPVTTLNGLVAFAVIDLLNRPDRDRLALCPAPSCGQLYLRERTNQQWCGNACGNRARGARHHAGQRTAPPSG